ncbi:LytTr DNA-binding domain protein [Sphingobacterium spiritivorum ATCC 33300]|uniref:LytTr DNA-binding domain protein n=1 Tax=Sphingobacterium spiritivorum ATCC 33300 TaxID=525372 RepID=C2G4N0_SPHSI|nr:LytTR family DNA-binding domain-containing protein [Sphingobacterium spiritivorum]EEI89843.1 LytTr DNA-binding domain protein [Sphingobacterium spiritivorum ATCC 33300]QQS94826.1 LytTR family transcriptional regulator [Sphingobacterium spiritivorum]
MSNIESLKYLIKERDITLIISASDITHCVSMGAYTEVVRTNQKGYVIKKNIKTVLEELSHPYFMRVSRSLVVNIKYLKCIHNREKQLELESGIRLEFSIAAFKLTQEVEHIFKNSLKSYPLYVMDRNNSNE